MPDCSDNPSCKLSVVPHAEEAARPTADHRGDRGQLGSAKAMAEELRASLLQLLLNAESRRPGLGGFRHKRAEECSEISFFEAQA